MLEIDGSYGEGGGQILRSAVALSALTGQELRISNIRAKRDRPGLAAQHLAAVRGVASLCDAELSRAEVGSTEITFSPGKVKGGEHRIDVGTAGSVTLVLQACLLASVNAEKATELEVIGGTNVRMSPPADYYSNVLLPLLSRMGMDIKLEIVQRGFYPRGGGRVRAAMAPSSPGPLVLEERGDLVEMGGTSFTQDLPDHVAERMSHAIRKRLLGEELRIRTERASGASPGAGIALYAKFRNTVLGADALGERGVPSEKVGESAARRLWEELDGPGTLDVHAADQLVAYMALAGGPSSFVVREVTEHLRTQMWLVQQFLDVKFEVSKAGRGHRVEVVPARTSPGR